MLPVVLPQARRAPGRQRRTSRCRTAPSSRPSQDGDDDDLGVRPGHVDRRRRRPPRSRCRASHGRDNRLALVRCGLPARAGLHPASRLARRGRCPKSGQGRVVPMTRALMSALQRARHLRGERVLYRDDGTPIVHATVRAWLEACERRAGLEVLGAFTSSATRSARISRCEGRPPRPSRSSLVTRT